MIFRLFLLVLLVCSGVFFFFMFTHQEEFLAFIAKTQPETTQSWNTKQVREMRSNATQKLNNLGYLHKILTEKFPEKQDKFDRFFTDTFPGAMLRRAQVLIYHEKSYQRAYDLAKLLLPENAGAYEIIGVLYLEGHVYKKDLLQAEENFSRCVNEPDGFCAKQHDYTLNAITYYAGQAYSDKTPDNDAWAVNLLERAASQKYPPAMRTLAYALRDGIGIAQNPQRAILLFSEAAELGDVPSQASLGTMFFNGAGTQRDVLRALFWYYEAQKNNYEGKLGKHIAQASALIGRPELTPATPFTALINRARAGSAQAAFELYSQHAQTIAPISNFYEGGYWLRKSANSSYQPAQAAFPELIATCRETQKSLEDLSSDKSCMILNGAGYNFKNGKWKTN